MEGSRARFRGVALRVPEFPVTLLLGLQMLELSERDVAGLN